MKTRILLFVIMFLMPMGLSVGSLSAQTVTKAQQEAELKLQQAIDSQKRAMVEMKRAIDEQNKVIDLPLMINENSGSASSRPIDIYDIRNARPQGNDPFYGSQNPIHFTSGRTSWDFSKSVTESTFTKEYAIDVDKGSKDLSLSISGTLTSGEIRIAILMPGGKLYSEAVIDEFGNLNWRKSFQITDDSTDKIGEWKFKISSKNATGNFNISLRVN
jgi:hypothetical protein